MNLFESKLFDWHSFLLIRDYACQKCRYCEERLPLPTRRHPSQRSFCNECFWNAMENLLGSWEAPWAESVLECRRISS